MAVNVLINRSRFIFEQKSCFFLELDPDYVEFLKLKKQKALEAEKAMTDEQKQSKF